MDEKEEKMVKDIIEAKESKSENGKYVFPDGSHSLSEYLQKGKDVTFYVKHLEEKVNVLETKLNNARNDLKLLQDSTMEDPEFYGEEIEVARLKKFLDQGPPWRNDQNKRVITLNRIASGMKRNEYNILSDFIEKEVMDIAEKQPRSKISPELKNKIHEFVEIYNKAVEKHGKGCENDFWKKCNNEEFIASLIIGFVTCPDCFIMLESELKKRLVKVDKVFVVYFDDYIDSIHDSHEKAMKRVIKLGSLGGFEEFKLNQVEEG